MFSQALKTIRARADGATLDEIKESFREIDLYHHDPLTLLRWQHDNRGWGFKMNPTTGRITVWSLSEPTPAPRTSDGRPKDLMTALKESLGMTTQTPALAAAPDPDPVDLIPALKAALGMTSAASLHGDEKRDARTSRPVAPTSTSPASTFEFQRHELQEQQAQLMQEIAQRRSETDGERLRLEEERRRFEAERREFEAKRQQLLNASAVVPPGSKGVPAWLVALPQPDRYVFQHLAEHGSINEVEATKVLGGPRQFRRFSMNLEEHLSHVPFKVRIEISGDIKCYVREGGPSE